jgi:hypothetical protein
MLEAMKALLPILLPLVLTGTPAGAAPAPAAADEARIPFPNRGGILRMQADGDDLLYVQDRHQDWYRAQLYGPCFGLSRALGIGFDTRGSSDFDRFSTIVVGDERCQIRSLTRSGPPPSKRNRRAAR